ncbi:unnamed protein product, partial [marine sediment metagenome]
NEKRADEERETSSTLGGGDSLAADGCKHARNDCHKME